MVEFEERPDWKHGIAYGRCSYSRCPNFKKLFKFPLTPVEVDFLDEKDL
jgi:hypothetical protein